MSANIVDARAKGDSDATTLVGTPSGVYLVKLRVRGVVPLRSYSGGVLLNPYVMQGGIIPVDVPYRATARLYTTQPSETYNLNYGAPSDGNVALDYMFSIPLQAGGTITLELDNGNLTQYYGDSENELVEVPQLPVVDGIWMQVEQVRELHEAYEVLYGGGVRGWRWHNWSERLLGLHAER